jgi:hypothetical protein
MIFLLSEQVINQSRDMHLIQHNYSAKSVIGAPTSGQKGFQQC